MRDSITTPQQFFDRIVVPDIQALKTNPEDVRLAFHAAISLHQLREWVFKALPDPKPDFAGQWCPDLYKRCEALKFIGDLASNAKHFPPVWDEAVQHQVIAKDEAGKSEWVVPAVLHAFAFWSKETK